MRTQTMHKVLFTVVVLVATVVVGAPVSRVTNFVDGEVLTASQLNSEFNNVIGGVNSINNAQIATNAQIAPSKLSATIKGSGISRDATTGALSAKPDDVTLEVSGDNIQIKDSGVSLAKMADSSVDTAELVDGAVSTAKIEDGAVTAVKKAAVGEQISASSGAFGTSSAFAVDVTNLSVTLTTTGRPVYVGLISVQADQESHVTVDDTDSEGAAGFIQFIYGASTVLSLNRVGIRTATGSATDDPKNEVPCSSFNFVAVLPAATYTFKTRAYVEFTGDGIDVTRCRMIAYEL